MQKTICIISYYLIYRLKKLLIPIMNKKLVIMYIQLFLLKNLTTIMEKAMKLVFIIFLGFAVHILYAGERSFDGNTLTFEHKADHSEITWHHNYGNNYKNTTKTTTVITIQGNSVITSKETHFSGSKPPRYNNTITNEHYSYTTEDGHFTYDTSNITIDNKRNSHGNGINASGFYNKGKSKAYGGSIYLNIK